MRKRRKRNPKIAPVIVPRVSEIPGEGYGSNHLWFRGITNEKPNKQPHKYTEYACLKCGQWFRHLYELIPDIFVAMEKIGILEECK